MDDNDPVADIVSMLDNEIVKAEKRVARLRAARIALGVTEDVGMVTVGGFLPDVLPSVKGMSIPDACETLLRFFKKPRKARTLAEAMIKAGYEYSKGPSKLRASLTGSIDRYIRLGDGRFVKTGPGTYALVEWDQPGSTNITDITSISGIT